MVIKTEVGRIIWHDLLTNAVTEARHFYAELLGWKYQIEHASNFAWKPGEAAEYPLIMANGEAHGGFVNSAQNMLSHWIAYVRVEDVDTATAKAKMLGATIDREPFDTLGVGRSAVIRDPQGAIICLHVPTHSFPAPRGTFLWEELITEDVQSAERFYGELFGWQANDIDTDQIGRCTLFKCADGVDVAGVVKRSLSTANSAIWIPYLATNDIDVTVARARAIGASVYTEKASIPHLGQLAILADPTGAIFGLLGVMKK